LGCVTDQRKPLINARVIIDGPAEEIFAALRYMKGGKRAVHLHVEVSQRHYSDRAHYLPEIKEGQTHEALRNIPVQLAQVR
jgi:hypothetical protein